MRRPPRSPLFPSTTLFRSSGSSSTRAAIRSAPTSPGRSLTSPSRKGSIRSSRFGSCSGGSEEHTPELQSRQYLVCRLLLEKKNRLAGPALGEQLPDRPSVG